MSPDELREVIGRVQLTDVRLIDAKVQTRIRDANRARDAQLTMRHAAQVILRKDNAFLIAAQMQAAVVRDADSDKGEPLVTMSITYALEYALEGTSEVSEGTLAEFARVNGAFNAWPYWREYIQTTSARMNLPPIVLPVFRVVSPEKKAPAQEPKEKSKVARSKKR